MPVTRIMWCPDCYNRNLPRSNHLFLVYATTREGLFPMRAKRRGTRGMTPHICEYLGLDEKGRAKIETICAMNGCGLRLTEKANDAVSYLVIRRKIIRMTVLNWNALQYLKNDPQFEI